MTGPSTPANILELPVTAAPNLPAVSGAATMRIRFDGANALLSEAGAPYAPFASVGSIGWVRIAGVVLLFDQTDQVGAGLAPTAAEKMLFASEATELVAAGGQLVRVAPRGEDDGSAALFCDRTRVGAMAALEVIAGAATRGVGDGADDATSVVVGFHAQPNVKNGSAGLYDALRVDGDGITSWDNTVHCLDADLVIRATREVAGQGNDVDVFAGAATAGSGDRGGDIELATGPGDGVGDGGSVRMLPAVGAEQGTVEVVDGAFWCQGASGVTPAAGAGTRLMWIPAKAAFRAGSVVGGTWDDALVGDGSVAFGANTTASGAQSAALGINTTASGADSFAAGSGTLATNTFAVAMGNSVAAQGVESAAFGRESLAPSTGQYVWAGGQFTSRGDAQHIKWMARIITTDAATTEMFVDGAGVRMVLPDNATWTFSILVTARRTDADNEGSGFLVQGLINRNVGAATTALLGGIIKTVIGPASARDFIVTADAVNGSLKLEAEGDAAETFRWAAVVDITQVLKS